MTNAYVLMTAMPPTKGHINLIEFANELMEPHNGEVRVIVCTQPDEPFTSERVAAIREQFRHNDYVVIHQLHQVLEQDPAAPGFWDMWVDLMHSFGFTPGDWCVSSEPYGKTLANLLGGHFMPYDPQRELYYTKATQIRDNPFRFFSDIATTFQPYVRQTVTFFGSESTGKTTLSKEISYRTRGHWLFEWARPYLETVGTEITVDSMTDIWQGQRAIQAHGQRMTDKPWVVQDTDLFSTVGYWMIPHWLERLGPVPAGLIEDAETHKSDLYIITQSNIPFEKDAIRYKSDEGIRETTDEFWIDLAEKHKLNFHVLESVSFIDRIDEATEVMRQHFDKTASLLTYDRKGL